MTGQFLHQENLSFSFIGLVNFYHRYAPYLEIQLKPLRKMVKRFYRKPIPTAVWTPELSTLFTDLKVCITSSPVIARFYPTKITFLKIDWSSEGMGWILMQPADDDESLKFAQHLRKTGIYLFDLSLQGARLKLIAFGSRSCNDTEKSFHLFTGKGACGQWVITQNRTYLRGYHFYWLCDCSAIKEILEYNGNIPMICRWAQELLAYQYSVIHRNKRMMADVDALTRRFGPLIASHCYIAKLLHRRDVTQRSLAYEASYFHSSATAKLVPPNTALPATPIVSSTYLESVVNIDTTNDIKTNVQILSSIPVMFITASSVENIGILSDGAEMKITAVAKSYVSKWWCINDHFGTLLQWSNLNVHKTSRWLFK